MKRVSVFIIFVCFIGISCENIFNYDEEALKRIKPIHTNALNGDYDIETEYEDFFTDSSIERIKKKFRREQFVTKSSIDRIRKKFSQRQDNVFKQMLTVEPNLLYDDNNIKHRRFVRHVEAVAVTESIISHIMKKLKQRYPQLKKQPKSLSKVMRNLKQRLNKYIHKKKPNRTRSTKINKNIRKKITKNKQVMKVQLRKPKREKFVR